MTPPRSPGAPPDPAAELTVRPIGVVRSPFKEKVSAPRQPAAARDVAGTIELFARPGIEHAVCDLEGCTHLWVIFWFHLAHDFRPKVLPPRSAGQRRGVLATRSPHRPNPIGLSVVRLDRVDALTLHIRDVDMLDGTPVLDVKPYAPYTDSVPHARIAWLAPLVAPADPSTPSLDPASALSAPATPSLPADPEPGFDVAFAPEARATLDYLREQHALDLAPMIVSVLSLGPQPHPYRRIRKVEGGLVLAVKDWRARFVAAGRRIEVTSIDTGYRPKQLALGIPGVDDAILAPHRAVWSRTPRRS
ncbi:MAG: tRNA (N6-threonylcarbamoyladenosine(37)-N6)-methyltransferase TrmO [Polyangiaceae bacterium]